MKIESLVKVGTLLYWGWLLSLVIVVKILVFVDLLEYPKNLIFLMMTKR